MNWNGGVLSRSRNTVNTSLSAAQKRHFARARANAQTPRQFNVDLEFSALEHAKKDKLATRRRNLPSRRADHHAASSKASPASLNAERGVIPPSSSPPLNFSISSECKKDDSLKDQKRKLLDIKDWCGVTVSKVATSIADVVSNRNERQGCERSKKRPLLYSSEAYSPSEGLAGIIDSLKTPDARNLHNTEEKRYRANKRQRIVRLDDKSGAKLESHLLHKTSPFDRERAYASPYLDSDEDLFADEHTKSQPLFQPSPLRSIAYDWSDIKSDAVLSASSQLETRSLTDSPVATEQNLAHHHRSPSMLGLPQVHSDRLPTDFTADTAPMITRDSAAQVTKRGFLNNATYAHAKPKLHSDLTRFLPEDDIFETAPNRGKFDQHPLNIEPIFQYSEGNAQLYSTKNVEIAAMDSIEYKPRAQEVFCTPSRLLAQPELYEHVSAENVWNEDVASTNSAVAAPMILKEGTIGNPTSTAVRSPRKTKGEELLSPNSGWRDFVIGSADGEISDISSNIRRCVKSQTDPQSPDSCSNKGAPSPPSSPHQFDLLYSESGNDPFLDQQSPQESHQHQENYSPLSSSHRFRSISLDQPEFQYTAHAANNSIPEASREIPLYPPEHSLNPRHQLASPHDRGSTEELEQPAERFVKPTFIFTKPARFVGDQAIGLSISAETGEPWWGSGQPDSRLGYAEEDIEG